MAIKEYFGNKALQEWEDKKVVARNEEALDKYRLELANQIDYYKVTQYFFFTELCA